MAKPQQELAWRGPTIGWMTIVLLSVAVLIIGKMIARPLHFPLAMLLAASMLITPALGPVGLAREKGLLRLIACAGFFFIAVLFILSFADLVARLG
jgi:hypothetical protein